MRRKLTLGLIDTDAGVQFVDIDRKSIGFHDRNADVVTFRYVDGFRRNFAKSLPDKAFRTHSVPTDSCYFFPDGLRDGRLYPDEVQFVFGLCHMVSNRKVEELAREKVVAMRLKTKLDEEKKRKEELEDQVKELQKMMSMLK